MFQQYGVKPHTARSVNQWFRDCEVDFIDDWPGYSPDLSPIESLWQIIKKDLQRKDVSSVLQNLRRRSEHHEIGIEPQKLQNVDLSVPRRLKDVIKRKSNPTKC